MRGFMAKELTDTLVDEAPHVQSGNKALLLVHRTEGRSPNNGCHRDCDSQRNDTAQHKFP